MIKRMTVTAQDEKNSVEALECLKKAEIALEQPGRSVVIERPANTLLSAVQFKVGKRQAASGGAARD